MAQPAPSALKVTKEVVADKGVVILTVKGDLDAHTTKALEAAITELFMANQYKVIVDMANVNYMSSAGAGLFLGAQEEAKDAAGDVVLLQPTSDVRYVLDLLGVIVRFQIAETRESALAAFCK
jgi:anti-sigma B factor antagonist